MSDLWIRAQDSIAQGCLTNSKHPRSFVNGVYPKFVRAGTGPFIIDEAGKTYFDFIQSLGAGFMGHSNHAIMKEVEKHLHEGVTLSLPTRHEVELAEQMKEFFPWVDKMKFLKTGTEACMAAVKIARAATGRKVILSEGYHGWSDGFVSLTPPHHGVPIDPSFKKLNSIDCVRDVGKDLAAVIVEPVILDWSKNRQEWLQKLQKACQDVGALLIFDEVITGFRFKRFGVNSYFGIVPDLLTLGKSIAGGFPLSAVCGKTKIMECAEYFVSSTFAGEVLSLVAAKKALNLLRYDLKYCLEALWRSGEDFLAQFNAVWPEMIKIDGYPTRGAFVGDDEQIAIFMQEACKARMLFCKSWFYNFGLAQEKQQYMQNIVQILERMKRGEYHLEGDLPQKPFAAKVRGQ